MKVSIRQEGWGEGGGGEALGEVGPLETPQASLLTPGQSYGGYHAPKKNINNQNTSIYAQLAKKQKKQLAKKIQRPRHHVQCIDTIH